MTNFLSGSLRLVLLLLACAGVVLADTKVVLPDERKFAEGDGTGFLVETTIPGDFDTPDGVVRALLAPGAIAAKPGLSMPFFPETIRASGHCDGANPLSASFLGARWKGRTIVLSFSGEAMRYLNNALAIQEFVKGSIEGTLRLNFPQAKRIDYEIDGEIVRQWDA